MRKRFVAQLDPSLLTRVLAAISAFSFLTLCGSARADDWLQWRGPDRANRSAETGLFETWTADGPPLEWNAQGLGEGYAGVSVRGDWIYSTGNNDEGQFVIALNASDGSVRWKTVVTDSVPKHGYGGSRSTPTIDGDHVYIVSSDGRIVCLSAEQGEIVWQRDFDEFDGKMMSSWGFSESPLVDEDRVVCTPGGNRAVVVALDKLSGETIWECKLPRSPKGEVNAKGASLKDGSGYSSCVISNGGRMKQYVQMVGRGLIGIHAKTGIGVWRYKNTANTTANIPTTIAEGDYVVTSTGYGTGSAMLKLSKRGRGVRFKTVWALEGREFQVKHGGMTLVDGYIYAGHGNGAGMPVCVQMKTGKIMWGPERAKGSGEASFIYADDHLVVRREDGTVMLIRANPKKFDLVHSFKPEFQQGKSWAHPVIANGKLYLREQDRLMCYRLK